MQVSKASSAQASAVQATSAVAAASLPATVPLAVGQVAAAAAGEVVALRAECAHMDEQLALVSAQLAAVHSERDAEQCGPVLRSLHKCGLCSSLFCRYSGFHASAKQRFKCCYGLPESVSSHVRILIAESKAGTVVRCQYSNCLSLATAVVYFVQRPRTGPSVCRQTCKSCQIKFRRRRMHWLCNPRCAWLAGNSTPNSLMSKSARQHVVHVRRANLQELAEQMAALRGAWQADAAALAELGARAAGLEASEEALAELRAEHARFQERTAMLQRLLTVRRCPSVSTHAYKATQYQNACTLHGTCYY